MSHLMIIFHRINQENKVFIKPQINRENKVFIRLQF